LKHSSYAVMKIVNNGVASLSLRLCLCPNNRIFGYSGHPNNQIFGYLVIRVTQIKPNLAINLEVRYGTCLMPLWPLHHLIN
jgi:hypothetical protein